MLAHSDEDDFVKSASTIRAEQIHVLQYGLTA